MHTQRASRFRPARLPLCILLIVGIAHAGGGIAAAPTDDARLETLHRADQDERQALFRLTGAERDKAAAKVWQNDVARQREVRQRLRDGRIVTAKDYWRAAFIMQHGADLDDIKLAFSLGSIATALAPDVKDYRWITAAAWDRILVYKQQPQWYGTQFTLDPKTGRQTQVRIAEGAVTDAERQALGVPTLEESEAMLKQINAGSAD